MADFNNPLAGKEVDYDFKINKIIKNNKEKINALQDFFFRQRFEFDIDENKKKIIFKEDKIKPIIDVFKDKFKTMTGFDFVVEEKKTEKKQEKVEEKKD
jgi:hypothetical protein